MAEDTSVIVILLPIQGQVDFVSKLRQNRLQHYDYMEIAPRLELIKILYPAANCLTIFTQDDDCARHLNATSLPLSIGKACNIQPWVFKQFGEKELLFIQV